MKILELVLDYVVAIRDMAFDLSPWPTNVTLLVAATMVLVGILSLYNPRILLFPAFAAYTSMLFNPTVVTLPDLRIPAVLMAVLLGMLRRSLPTFSSLRRGIFPAVLVYLAIGVAVLSGSVDAGESLNTLLGVLLALVFAWFILGAASPEEIRAAVHGVMATVVVVSFVLVVAMPDKGIEADRWRGLMENANSLGLIAGIFFLTAAPWRTRWSAAPLVAVILGTASRASAFGLGLVAGPKLLERQSLVVRRAVAIVALAVAVPLLNAVFFGSDTSAGSDSGLTRTKNSRADSWGNAVDLISTRPFTGVGAGNEPELVPSSVLRPMVELGLPAAVPVGMVMVASLRVLRSPRSELRSVYLFLFVNGAFEGWLFAGGSLYFVLFMVCGAARGREPPGGASEQPEVASDPRRDRFAPRRRASARAQPVA